MNKYQVTVDGVVVGKRTSARRVYTHAVVATRIQRWTNVAKDGGYQWGIEPIPAEQQGPEVLTWCGSPSLAHKAAAGKRIGSRLRENLIAIRVLPVEALPVVKRERVRCTGLVLEVRGEWARAMQCLKDATAKADSGEPRCALHVHGDNAAVRAQAVAAQEVYRAAEQAKMDADHRARYTAETCPRYSQPCPLHAEWLCPIHGEPLVETHPADAENGPQPEDLENERVCPTCEDELAHAPATCLAHRLPLDECLPCLYDEPRLGFPVVAQ